MRCLSYRSRQQQHLLQLKCFLTRFNTQQAPGIDFRKVQKILMNIIHVFTKSILIRKKDFVKNLTYILILVKSHALQPIPLRTLIYLDEERFPIVLFV